MESFNLTYNFWPALLETILIILVINLLINVKLKKRRLLDSLAANQGYVYSIVTLLIIISALYFISIFPYRYLPWLLIASLGGIVYAMYFLYNRIIKSDEYNKWLDTQTDQIQERLTTALIFIARILPSKGQGIIAIKTKLLEELMRFDQNNIFEEQVLNEIYSLGEPKVLIELAKKFGYLKFVYSTIRFTEIEWPDGTKSRHLFSSGDYISNTRWQTETEDRYVNIEERSR